MSALRCTVYRGKVILGAIGSGFWEKIFKPFVTTVSRLLLKASTFGFATARDSIYKEVARRSLHKPLQFIVLVFAAASSMYLGTTVADFQKYYNIAEVIRAEADQVKRLDEIKNMPKELAIKEIAALTFHLHEQNRQIASLKLLVAIWLLIITGYFYLRYSYVSTAIYHFDQCIALCAPYISENEKLQYFAQFASVSTKDDFIRLLTSIDDIAKKNNVKLPYFSKL